MKVEKLFHSLPEYIESCLQSSDDKAGQSQILLLTENIIHCVADKELKDILKTILKKENDKVSDTVTPEDIVVKNFLKNTWQQLVYATYIIPDNSLQDDTGELFSIIENEENLNRRLDKLNKNSIGLTGLAGLGLGLLFSQMKKGLRTVKSEVRMESIIEKLGK